MSFANKRPPKPEKKNSTTAPYVEDMTKKGAQLLMKGPSGRIPKKWVMLQ
jgi:hypothetical protein